MCARVKDSGRGVKSEKNLLLLWKFGKEWPETSSNALTV